MKTRLLTIIFTALSTFTSWAQTIEKDGLKYSLDSETHTAEVIAFPGGSITTITQEVIVPSSIVADDGETYAVESIGKNAFAGAYLLYVFFEKDHPLKRIESYAFSHSMIKSIDIPKGVTSIGAGAFYYCTDLEYVSIPDGVVKVGGDAFYETMWIEKQHDGPIYVGKVLYKYKNKENLKTIAIKEGTVAIGEQVFSYAEKLSFVSLPSSLKLIDYNAFYQCKNLNTITLPDGLETIGTQAFSGCGLKEIIIPNSVTLMGQSPFGGCKSLESVIYGTGVEYFMGFANCTSLKNVYIPNGIKSIYEEALSYSGVTSVTIPSTVKSIEGAFKNCPNLTDVYCLAESVPETDMYAFYSYDLGPVTYAYKTLHVPANCAEAYRSIFPWNQFETIVEDAKPNENPGERYVKISEGKFTSRYYSENYNAALYKSKTVCNRYKIKPFFSNEEGLVIDITEKQTDSGAYILKITPAPTGKAKSSYGIIWAQDAEEYGASTGYSYFDGEKYVLFLVYYLDGIGYLSASQEIFQPFGTDGVLIPEVDEQKKDSAVVGYYNIQGQQLKETRRGVNIIRHSDGTSRKVVVE